MRRHIALSIEANDSFTEGIVGLLGRRHGLSLNDAFWFVRAGAAVDWDKINLYNTPFPGRLYHVRPDTLTYFFYNDRYSIEQITAEFTRKYWERVDGRIMFFKTAQTDSEKLALFSELTATRMLEVINRVYSLDYCAYKLKDKGTALLSCELFCAENLSFIDARGLLGQGVGHSRDRIVGMYPDLARGVDDMLVFDFIAENRDRHSQNYGCLIDLDTGRMANAPIFDNGYTFLQNETDSTFRAGIDNSESSSFGVTNFELAKAALGERHRPWALEILSNLDYIVSVDAAEELNKNGMVITGKRLAAIRELLTSRCGIIEYLLNTNRGGY
jgi:hypothetical protein